MGKREQLLKRAWAIGVPPDELGEDQPKEALVVKIMAKQVINAQRAIQWQEAEEARLQGWRAAEIKRREEKMKAKAAEDARVAKEGKAAEEARIATEAKILYDARVTA